MQAANIFHTGHGKARQTAAPFLHRLQQPHFRFHHHGIDHHAATGFEGRPRRLQNPGTA